MADNKQDVIEMEGVVSKVLPNSEFQVKLPNGVIINAHVSGKVRLYYVKIFTGDRVRIQISRYDLTRGRIVYRYR